MAMPERLYLPLRQHVGVPAEPVVQVGARVHKGQLLARSGGPISAPIHASTSGVIADITEFTAPHPSGLAGPTIILDPDGEDRWGPRNPPADPFSLEPDEIATRVGAAGVVGMGGAAFPSAVKLDSWRRRPIRTLIINGAECEPYLTCDDRLMRERASGVVDGARLMMRALGACQVMLAVEANKPEALASLAEAARDYAYIEVRRLPVRYPNGSAQHLVTLLTGSEVPAGGRSADVGAVVYNVATAHAVYRALVHDEPLLSRVVTVDGGAVTHPGNLEVPLGALVEDLLRAAGGVSGQDRLIIGGPMMGVMLPHARVPVVKGTSGILALSVAETARRPTAPCIRCGRCVQACPCGLVPLEMAARVRTGDLEGAAGYGLEDCINCGACAYICPSFVPLTQYFQHGQGGLKARRAAVRKIEATRLLAERRSARLAREAQRKAEEAAQRKAARQKQQAAKAAKEGAP